MRKLGLEEVNNVLEVTADRLWSQGLNDRIGSLTASTKSMDMGKTCFLDKDLTVWWGMGHGWYGGKQRGDRMCWGLSQLSPLA